MEQLQPDHSASDEVEIETPIERGLTLIEIAAMEGLPIGLAKELMEEVEKLGHAPVRAHPISSTAFAPAPANGQGGPGGAYGLVRDDQAEQGAGGTRWYRDLISSWEL